MTTAIWIIAAAYFAVYIVVHTLCGRAKKSRTDRVRVSVNASRPRRSILRNVETSQQAMRQARQASLDRRYYREMPW